MAKPLEPVNIFIAVSFCQRNGFGISAVKILYIFFRYIAGDLIAPILPSVHNKGYQGLKR